MSHFHKLISFLLSVCIALATGLPAEAAMPNPGGHKEMVLQARFRQEAISTPNVDPLDAYVPETKARMFRLAARTRSENKHADLESDHNTVEISWQDGQLTKIPAWNVPSDHEKILLDKIHRVLSGINSPSPKIHIVLLKDKSFRLMKPVYTLDSHEGSDPYVWTSRLASDTLQLKFRENLLRDVHDDSLRAIFQNELTSTWSDTVLSRETLAEQSDAIRTDTGRAMEYRIKLATVLKPVINVRAPELQRWLGHIDYDLVYAAYTNSSNLDSLSYRDLFRTWWHSENPSDQGSPVINALRQLANGVRVEHCLNSKGGLLFDALPPWMQAETSASLKAVGSIFTGNKENIIEVEFAYFSEFSTWLPVALIRRGVDRSKNEPISLRTLIVPTSDATDPEKKYFVVHRIGNRNLRPRHVPSTGSLFGHIGGSYIVCGRISDSEEIYSDNVTADDRRIVASEEMTHSETHGLYGRRGQLYAAYYDQNDVINHILMIGGKEDNMLGVAAIKDRLGKTTQLLQSHQKWTFAKWQVLTEYYRDHLLDSTLWWINTRSSEDSTGSARLNGGSGHLKDESRIWRSVFKLPAIFRKKPVEKRMEDGLVHYIRIKTSVADVIRKEKELYGWIAEVETKVGFTLIPVLRGATAGGLQQALNGLDDSEIFMGRFLRWIEFRSPQGRRLFGTTFSDITQESLSAALEEKREGEILVVGELLLHKYMSSVWAKAGHSEIQIPLAVAGGATHAEITFEHSPSNNGLVVPTKIRIGKPKNFDPYKPGRRTLNKKSSKEFDVIPKDTKEILKNKPHRYKIAKMEQAA